MIATVLIVAPPSSAQQSARGEPPAMAHPLNLQPPAPDLGPTVARPVPGPPETPECAPAWPCRLRLFGEIEKFGGVGLKGPALTW